MTSQPSQDLIAMVTTVVFTRALSRAPEAWALGNPPSARLDVAAVAATAARIRRMVVMCRAPSSGGVDRYDARSVGKVVIGATFSSCRTGVDPVRCTS